MKRWPRVHCPPNKQLTIFPPKTLIIGGRLHKALPWQLVFPKGVAITLQEDDMWDRGGPGGAPETLQMVSTKEHFGCHGNGTVVSYHGIWDWPVGGPREDQVKVGSSRVKPSVVVVKPGWLTPRGQWKGSGGWDSPQGKMTIVIGPRIGQGSARQTIRITPAGTITVSQCLDTSDLNYWRWIKYASPEAAGRHWSDRGLILFSERIRWGY